MLAHIIIEEDNSYKRMLLAFLVISKVSLFVVIKYMDNIYSDGILVILTQTIDEWCGQLSFVLHIPTEGLSCAEFCARHKRNTKIDKLEYLPLESRSPSWRKKQVNFGAK